MSKSQKLWGGRFSEETDSSFADFNNSFKFDSRLLQVDVQASIAYAHSLQRIGVLNDAEADAIQRGLSEILQGAKDSTFFDTTAEDVHSFVEAELVKRAGDAGRKLHTGRSRNDQVATDFRLWTRQAIDDLLTSLRYCQSALLSFAEQNLAVVIPGYTHLQKAQPVLLAHWCMAYFEMLTRDCERLRDCRLRVNIMPLGSAALAGSSYLIDRDRLAEELGFEGVSRNSLDAVSDRDFCAEFLSACSLIMVHLSRMAEDIILYSTSEFGFLEFGDAIATGSSLMPQKKNPDSMELVRGKAGRVFGDLLSMLTTMKGLPLAYNKDMQEDKEAMFDAFDTVTECLQVTAIVLANITVNRKRTSASTMSGYMNATELADYLVRKGMPFRDAHEIVGQVVMRAIKAGVEIQELTETELRSFSELIEADVFEALSLEQTLSTKNLSGGTSTQRVKEAVAKARQSLLDGS